MKQIETLVQDLEKLFLEPHEFDKDNIAKFGKELAELVASRVNPQKRKPSLRMSNLGTKCDKKLWYSINKEESGEALPFEARMKFLFGDILESLLLFFAKEADRKSVV